MKRNPKTLLWIGLVLLAIGAFLSFGPGSGPASASSATEAACRTEMAKRGGDASLAERCTDANFATAITATNASDAAAVIAANNNAEIGGSAIGKFLIGMGLVLTLFGFLAPMLRKKD